MAEKKAEKKPEAAPAAQAADKGEKKEVKPVAAGGLLTKTPVLLAGAMLIEAVILIGGLKFLGAGSPKAAAGAELTTTEKTEGTKGPDGKEVPGADKSQPVEIQVVDFRAPNKLSGRTFLYDVSIFAVTKPEYADKVKEIISGRDALIRDRIRTIIAQSDPEKLGGGSEPGLETLRRQVKYQLDEIVGEGLVSEVLVPRCIPFRTDY